MAFIWYIIIGIIAGFVAGKLMRGGGFGLIVNLVVGIIGGVLGGWLFGLIGISTSSIIGNLITSVVGAIVLLWIVGIISRTSSPRQETAVFSRSTVMPPQERYRLRTFFARRSRAVTRECSTSSSNGLTT